MFKVTVQNDDAVAAFHVAFALKDPANRLYVCIFSSEEANEIQVNGQDLEIVDQALVECGTEEVFEFDMPHLTFHIQFFKHKYIMSARQGVDEDGNEDEESVHIVVHEVQEHDDSDDDTPNEGSD